VSPQEGQCATTYSPGVGLIACRQAPNSLARRSSVLSTTAVQEFSFHDCEASRPAENDESRLSAWRPPIVTSRSRAEMSPSVRRCRSHRLPRGRRVCPSRWLRPAVPAFSCSAPRAESHSGCFTRSPCWSVASTTFTGPHACSPKESPARPTSRQWPSRQGDRRRRRADHSFVAEAHASGTDLREGK
jgi:hypothetical protein